MKKRFLLLLFLFCGPIFWAQNETIDSLKRELKTVKDDKQTIMLLKQLSYELHDYNPVEAFTYARESLERSKKIKWDVGIAYGYQHIGLCYLVMSNTVKALEYLDKADSIFTEMKDQKGLYYSNFAIGRLFSKIDNNDDALIYLEKAYKIAISTEGSPIMISSVWDQMSMAYRRDGQYNKAIYYANKSLELDTKLKYKKGIATSFVNLGIANYNLKHYSESQQFFNEAFVLLKGEENLIRATAEAHAGAGLSAMAFQMPDSITKTAFLNRAATHLKHGIVIYKKLNDLINNRKSNIDLYKVAKALHDDKLADQCSYNAFTLGNKILQNEKHEFVVSLKREQAARKILLESQKKSNILIYISVFFVILITLLGMVLRKHSLQRKTNSILAEKNEELGDKKAEIEKLNIQKDQFYSIIAHDLRGSLGGFHALTEFLAEEGNSMDKEEIMESVVIMRDSANGLFGLLEGLLDWSKSEQGLVEFNPQVIELSQAVGHTIGILSENAYKKDIEIFADVKEDLTVYADDNLLQTVLRNLISNAIKFTPKGGKVEVTTQIDAMQNVEIQISDTGIGMNEQMVKDLFNSEVKTNRLGTDNEPSTGLGIVLCKEFVERHGGKIWVESKVGEGTVFHFNIPSKQHV